MCIKLSVPDVLLSCICTSRASQAAVVTVPRHSCWVALPSATCNSLCNAGLALPVVLRLTALDASGENSSFAAQQSHSPMPPYVSSTELAPYHLLRATG